MMRIDSLMQREWWSPALVLAAVLGCAACNEANGTEEWPGVYPPEEKIDRPKGGVDAGARDAGGGDGGAGEDGGDSLDADADGAAADDAGLSDAGSDASRQRDGGADARADGAPSA